MWGCGELVELSVDGGGGAGTTVTVVLSFGPVMVTVCDGWLGGDVGLTGVDLVSNRLIARIRATSTAVPAPATLNTSAVRLYQGSFPAAAA